MVDQSAVGRTFTPVIARVEPARLRFFLDTLGEKHALYRDAAGAIIPPTYLFCLEMLDAADSLEWLTGIGIDLAHILHGEQGFTYRASVTVGDVLTFRMRVADVAEKKRGAMTLVVYQTAVTNQHETLVAELARTIVVRNAVAA